jgi:hypothetical protein
MKLRHTFVLLVLLASGGAGATAAAAGTPPSHSNFWTVTPPNLYCGVEIHTPGTPATEIICSGSGIPAPPHTTSQDGDPGFVVIGRHGRPQLIRTSEDSFVGSKPVTLKAGTTWTDLGVTCTIATSSVRCSNQSSHGYKITLKPKAGYSAF